MLLLKSIIQINLFQILLCVAIVNGSCKQMSVTECIDVLKNAFEDEKRIREYIHEQKELLTETNTCEIQDALINSTSCDELYKKGIEISGVYTIYPKSWKTEKGIIVYCDMITDGGGWTVIQRRNESTDNKKQISFTRTWDEYAKGFGSLTEEFWLGNDNIHALTTQESVELRIELEDFDGNVRYAKYNKMEVGNKKSMYVLTLGKFSSGNAGDSFTAHSGQKFLTSDKDDTFYYTASHFKGGWWYLPGDYTAHLNGEYLRGRYSDTTHSGIAWATWLGKEYSLKRTEMKIRPKQ